MFHLWNPGWKYKFIEHMLYSSIDWESCWLSWSQLCWLLCYWNIFQYISNRISLWYATWLFKGTIRHGPLKDDTERFEAVWDGTNENVVRALDRNVLRRPDKEQLKKPLKVTPMSMLKQPSVVPALVIKLLDLQVLVFYWHLDQIVCLLMIHLQIHPMIIRKMMHQTT